MWHFQCTPFMTVSVCNNICLSYGGKKSNIRKNICYKSQSTENTCYVLRNLIYVCETIRDIYIVKHLVHIVFPGTHCLLKWMRTQRQ